MNLSVANIWKEAGATVTGLGILAVALTPLLSGSPPATAAGWVTEIAAFAMAVLKAIGD